MCVLSFLTKKRHVITSGFCYFPDYENICKILDGVQVDRENYASYCTYIMEF